MLCLDDDIDNEAENPAATRCREEAVSRCWDFHFSVFPQVMRLVFFSSFLPLSSSSELPSSVAANRAVVGELDREITRRSQKRQKEAEGEKKKHLVESEGYKRDD